MTYLIVNRSDSRCGACNKNADPYEPAHLMKHMAGEGCGAEYTALSSDYFGMDESVKRVRPDLPFTPCLDRMAEGSSA